MNASSWCLPMFACRDHIEAINGRFGDDVLIDVAARILDPFHEGSLVARIGGEELAVLVPGASWGAAMGSAEHLRQSIAATSAGRDESEVEITVSIGVACSTPDEVFELDGIPQVADRRLYRATQLGRNRVCTSDA